MRPLDGSLFFFATFDEIKRARPKRARATTCKSFSTSSNGGKDEKNLMI